MDHGLRGWGEIDLVYRVKSEIQWTIKVKELEDLR